MQKHFNLPLFIWLFTASTCTFAIDFNNCAVVNQLDHDCASYCYKVMRPMLQLSHHWLEKDARLAELEQEVSMLRQQLAIYEESEMNAKQIQKISVGIKEIKEQLKQTEGAAQSAAVAAQAAAKAGVAAETAAKAATATASAAKAESAAAAKASAKAEAAAAAASAAPTAPTKKTRRSFSDFGCLSFDDDSSSVHEIKVPGYDAFSVRCSNNIAGRGWTVIQQRLYGNTSFYRNWHDYREGFGDLNGDFFIGLEKLHQLLSLTRHELYIAMVHRDDRVAYARYDNFRVDDESSNYKLSSLGTFNGNTVNSLQSNVGMMFSTFDRDNDKLPFGNCAELSADGWWHNSCFVSNLNGIYNDTSHCIHWHYDTLRSNDDCLKRVHMLIRPVT